MFVVEKSAAGLTVSRDIEKLGYKGIETCEVLFEDFAVPAANLIGGAEGSGFMHVMSGLEVGRINVAARAVGVAQAAFEDAIRYAQQRTVRQADLPASGDPAEARRHGHQDRSGAPAGRQRGAQEGRGERCDVEAGMAKLFASEACAKVALEAMRILGGYGYMRSFPVERYYRDAPLMIIGEGTNEIQRWSSRAAAVALSDLIRFAVRPPRNFPHADRLE